MPSSLFGDPEPVLARPDADALLARDLELAGLVRGETAAHLARERRRVRDLVGGGGRAFLQGGTFPSPLDGQSPSSLPAGGSLALLRPLAWDSAHFGVPVADLARIYGTDGLDELLGHLLGHAAQEGVALLSARCRADQPAAAQALEACGFRWVDTSVELGRPAEGAREVDARVRDARPADAAALRPIARQFRRNRFHFDPRIAPEKAAGVYESWVTSAAEGRGEPLLVVEEGGAPRGFCGWRAPAAEDELRAATLTLIVVDEAARGRGLFDALVAVVLARAAAAGARWLITSTQVHNAASQRAFARHGLLPFSARHVFHRWAQ